MPIARINSLEYPDKAALDEHLINLRKKGGETPNPFAQMGMAFRTGPTSLIAIAVFPNQEAADKGLAFREELFASNKWFKEEWFMEGEFIQLWQNYMASEYEG